MRFSILLFLFCTTTGCMQREQAVSNCVAESDCGASGQACLANQCLPCSAHSDCQSQVCDTYGDLAGAGKCVAASSIIYVDNSEGNLANCNLASGELHHPYCDVASALAKLPTSPGKIIRLLASP